MAHVDYREKFKTLDKSFFKTLLEVDQNFIEKLAFQFQLTFQEFHKCNSIAREIEQWGLGPFESLIKVAPENKKSLFSEIEKNYSLLKTNKTYGTFKGRGAIEVDKITTAFVTNPEAKILGDCPVASDKTLCCNLETLDAVRNCGLDCSYCSIQSFYSGNEVIMDTDFGKKLLAIEIDSEKIYHIGTGQSSDSLMWGNKEGILDDLTKFAKKNPNVILELKTKSANIDYLLKNNYPRNIITTWSLNTPTIIDNEEHKTAALHLRLQAARKIADKKRLVGFHFHPMIHYDNYQNDYKEVVDLVLNTFSPEEVALVSIGTITFTKKVIKEIRSRDIKSKILQMPFEEVAGKFSYPDSIKEEMFSYLYEAFKPWHGKVFFYLCMEPAFLWPKVFGFQYRDNLEFEEKMKSSYYSKIINSNN
jgi:spore photoproduct lyase